MARLALKDLGPAATGLLCADPSQIWADPAVALAVDLDAHEEALDVALRATPGHGRDAALVKVLSTGGVPLEDEPEAEWAAAVRERVEYLRQEARLELARDRSRGVGRAHPEEVLQAWQRCLEAPTDEEAAAALMQLYVAQGRRPLAVAVYDRCRAALANLGMKTSPALEEVRANVDPRVPGPAGRSSPVGANAGAVRQLEERRLVSVVFVELAPAGIGGHIDPEDLRELISAGLAQTMSEVEAFGGTVASISGFGMSVLFGAPQSHEDDPERALRAALRIAAAVGPPEAGFNAPPGGGDGRTGAPRTALCVRIGVESGTAVVGPMGDGDQMRYGAVGEVVGVAAALQSAAKPGTVLVPGHPCRRRRDFRVGAGPGHTRALGRQPAQRELPGGGAATPGRRGRPSSPGGAGHPRRTCRRADGTDRCRARRRGRRGGAVVVVGEPGLGKTRLVSECRKFFMGWVGAASGRLPLWLEGRCASYASSTPYGPTSSPCAALLGYPSRPGRRRCAPPSSRRCAP